MFNDFPLFPESASSLSGEVDKLYIFMVVVCSLVGLAIIFTIIYFSIKYRRTASNQIPVEYEEPKLLELTWIVIPSIIFFFMFLWGVKLYFMIARPPDNALEVYATGRQWMWKFQHPGGQSEINELHVPVGRDIKILAASEDVIHDFYVPAFRIKTDVLPNRYTSTWFKATKTGRFHIFCAEYCGTQHSGMIGSVTVMEPTAFQTWLAGGATEGSPAVQGKKLFEKFACNTCHSSGSGARGPQLDGLFGTTVNLRGGGTARADENYIRESIVNPQAKVVDGFEPIMPTFKSQLNEAEIMQLLAYIKSLGISTTVTAATAPKGEEQAVTSTATRSPATARTETGSAQKTTTEAGRP